MKEKSWLMIVASAAPFHPPPEAVDEEWVEDDVGPRPEEHGEHGDLGAAVSTDEVVHPHAGDGEDRADEDDAQITLGIRHDLLTGPEGGEQRFEEEEAGDDDDGSGGEKEDDGVLQDDGGIFLAALAEADGEEGRPADPVEHPHRQEDDHDGEADRDAGDPVGPEAGGVADIDAVDDVVEGVDHHADDRREAETPEEAGDGLDAQGVLCDGWCIHVSSVLLLYTPVGCPNRRRGVHTPHRQ